MDAARIETWLWLASALGYAAGHNNEVLAAYPNPEQLVKERFTVDLSQLFTPAQVSALLNKEPEDFLCLVEECAQSEVQIVTFASEDYPALLRDIDSAPPVLYYRGDITLLNTLPTFAIVGTRRPSAYGVQATQMIAAELAKAGVALISGLATGLDSECHKMAVKCDAPTVACIAFGHNYCYPAAHKKLKTLIENTGLVIGEYPPNVPVQRSYFLQRNRIIAGLSRGICVAEARKKSGTMNTVSCALNYNRDVFAVPGSIFSDLSEGTNQLLVEGAIPATSPNDILCYYGLDAQTKALDKHEKPKPLLSVQAKQVAQALLCTPQTLAPLCSKTNLSPPVVMAALTELELADMCEQQAGRQFVLKQR